MTTQLQQIEQVLAYRVASVHQSLIGHSPTRVSCHCLNPKIVTVILEGVLTPLEKLLAHNGYTDLAHTIRLRLNEILQSRLIAETESILPEKVIDAFSDMTIASERISFMMLLEPTNLTARDLNSQTVDSHH